MRTPPEAVNHEAPPTSLAIGSLGEGRGLGDWRLQDHLRGKAPKQRFSTDLYLPACLLVCSSAHASTLPCMHPPFHACIHPSFSVQCISPKSCGKTNLNLLTEEIVLKTGPSRSPSLCPCSLSSPACPASARPVFKEEKGQLRIRAEHSPTANY